MDINTIIDSMVLPDYSQTVKSLMDFLNRAGSQTVGKMAKEAYSNAKLWIEDYRNSADYLISEEIKMWEYLTTVYTDVSAQKVEIDKNLTKLKEQELKAQEDIHRQIQGIENGYISTLEKRSQAIYDSFGIFDKLKERESVSSQSLMDNLFSQVTALEDWAENLSELGRRGVEEGLLAEIQKLGPSANEEITALLEMTDVQLTYYANLWREKCELAKTQAAEELSGLREASDAEIANLLGASGPELIDAAFVTGAAASDGMSAGIESGQAYISAAENAVRRIKQSFESSVASSGFQSVGHQIMQGLSDGIEAKIENLEGLISKAISVMKAAAEAAADINSPSRVFAEIGGFIGDGLAEGLKGAFGHIRSTAADMADVVTGAFNGVRPEIPAAAAGFAVPGQAQLSVPVQPVTVNQYIQTVPQTPSELANASAAALIRARWNV